jgi:hypothetical protein
MLVMGVDNTLLNSLYISRHITCRKLLHNILLLLHLVSYQVNFLKLQRCIFASLLDLCIRNYFLRLVCIRTDILYF